MLCVSCGFAAWFGYRNGKQYVLGAGMAVSLLAGTWFEIDLGGTEINVTIATAIILLVVYCTHSWREIFKSLHVMDYLIAALAVWLGLVDFVHDGFQPALAAEAYGQWILPYAAGRYAFMHRGSMSKLAPVFVSVAAFVSIAAVVESFTSWNLWEAAFVPVDDEVRRTAGQRYGLLYRAIGPTRNPIFLGIVFLTMLPFAVDLVSRADASTRIRALGWSGIVLIALGVLSTVSRGPSLCLPLALILGLAWYSRLARYTVIAGSILAAIIVSMNFNAAIDFLEGGTKDHVRSVVVRDGVYGDPMIVNSTRHRLLIPRIYGPLVLKGGLIGYGTTDSTGFPPKNIPGMPTDPVLLARLTSVDNSYINVGLRTGLVGLALFLALLIAVIVQCGRLAPVASTYLFPSDSRVIVAYATILIGVYLEIWTVFFSYDHAFWLLFQIGSVSGLAGQVMSARKASY